MKKFITAILMASVLASTPAMAQHRHDGDFPGSYREWQRDGDRWNRHDHYDRRDRRDRRRGPSTGGVVAAIIGGVILGAVIADDNRNHRRFREDRRWRNDRDYQVFRDDDYCYTEVWQDRYGDTYSRQICR